jgi:hypothetical protein
MFDKKTVFILGAGASWHYGYPTGEQLIKRVMDKSRIAEDYFQTAAKFGGTPAMYRPNYIMRSAPGQMPSNGTDGVIAQWIAAADECGLLREKLHFVDPLVIDYFLGQNPELSDIGKLLIAWVLLECEAKSAVRINSNRQDSESDTKFQDNWYRFLVHKLVTGCRDGEDLLKNNVTFVTFNYDVSLERRLYKALCSISQFADGGGVIPEFFKAPHRLVHVYGKLREIPWHEPPIGISFSVKKTPDDVSYWETSRIIFDLFFEASKQLKTIAPYEKNEDANVVAARSAIEEASCVYILGSGFDENNSKLLGLDETLYHQRPNPKTVLFTNYRNSNVINKKAGRLFFQNRQKFLSEGPLIEGGGDWLYEKSDRDVYGALELDFDSPEEA